MRIVSAALAAACLMGCGVPDADVTQADVERNRREFSQDAYEEAMKKAGRGKELDEEKARNEAYLRGQPSDSQSAPTTNPGQNPDDR